MPKTDVTPFTTNEDPKYTLPEGQTKVTTDELRFLTELSWGEGTKQYTCPHCSEVMTFERHPADFPSHPSEPGTLRVKIECPRCGGTTYTDGGTEVDFKEAREAELTAEVRAEVAQRMQVNGTDGGAGGDTAR